MSHAVQGHPRWMGHSRVCCSVAQSCPTLCDPMDCSTPGLPVLHHLPELAQTQVWANSQLWAMSCRTIQDRWVTAKSSDKTWSTGGGNGKPPQYTCCENLLNCIKGQKDMTPKDKSPRSESVQYATGEEQRRITNSSRMNEGAGSN